MILERIIITGILFLLGTGGFVAFRQMHVGRLNRGETATSAVLSAGVSSLTPTLLYFRSDTCAVCPTQGRYVEEVVKGWNGRLAIQKIDTDTEPETAQRYGVMSLPTTILVDHNGSVQDINYGLTNAHKLNKQVERVVGV
ncbi:MAG: thioredoxin [Chloroflexi bacterium]|nr:MAG: thioredoxin [Chloroflexota bacterium]